MINFNDSDEVPYALAPTDAVHVNETPKAEHDADNVLTAAQAREAALREAAEKAYEKLSRRGDWTAAQAVRDAILALIRNCKNDK